MELSIQNVIEEAQKRVEERARRTPIVDDPMQWERRREYLDELKASVERQMLNTIFVSYSSAEGAFVFRQIYDTLQGVKKLTVTSGFTTRPQATTVVETIVQQLERSSIYVGIFTPDIRIAPDTEGVAPATKAVSAPGVWTLEERGMAMALRKPLILMVHERVHPDFWKSVSAQQLYRFTRGNYKPVAAKVCDAVVTLRARLAQAGG